MPHGEWWGLAWLYEWLRRRDRDRLESEEGAARRLKKLRKLEKARRLGKTERRRKEMRGRPDRPPRRKRTRRRP